MGVVSFEMELESAVAPSRLFKALYLDSHNLLPKIIPHVFHSVSTLQGDGGVGSIKQINFVQGLYSFKNYLRYRVDKLDADKCETTNTVIGGRMEGHVIGEKLESITYKLQYVDDPDNIGSCIRKVSTEYRTSPDFVLKEEELELGKQDALHICKLVENHLLANPHLYSDD